MPNCYASIGQLKERLGRTGTSDDALYLSLLEEASREIDGWAGFPRRHFYSEIATRVFDGDGSATAEIDDLVSATTVKADDDGDGTYELTLASGTDYWLTPDNPGAYRPYRGIELNPESAVLTRWPTGRRRLQIVGTYGYSNEAEASGTLGAAISSTTATSVTMTAGHGLTGGETIIIDSEHLFVSAVSTNTLTVVRGVNGTTAATHSNGTTVTRRCYPSQVEGACLIRAGDNWRGIQTGYGRTAEAELGGFASNTAYAQARGLVGQVSREPVVVV